MNESTQMDGILQAMYNTSARQQILMGALLNTAHADNYVGMQI